MMLKERKGEVRRRRGGTVPEERDGGRQRGSEEGRKAGGGEDADSRIRAARQHPCKSRNVITVLDLAFSPPSALYSFKSSFFSSASVLTWDVKAA